MTERLFIADFIPVSLIDFPGKIASVVFTHGCSLRCRYCHNPELVTGIKDRNRLDDFLFHLRGKDIEGVAVTGGEPLVSRGILSFLREMRREGLDIKLDTNGFSRAKLERVCAEQLADVVAVDVKAFSDSDTDSITRVKGGLEPFFDTMRVLNGYKAPFELRHTLWKVPDRADVERLMERAGTDRISVQFPVKRGRWLDKRFSVYFGEDDAERVREVFSGFDVTYRNITD